jgi:hypothetical protein
VVTLSCTSWDVAKIGTPDVHADGRGQEEVRHANSRSHSNPAQERLSATIIGYWSAFARTGDPNGSDRPRWPEFGPAGTVIRLPAGGIGPTPFAAGHRCGFWAGLPR